MALPVQTKTWLLLGLGVVVIAFLLVPIRFTPLALQTIDMLTPQARGLLVQRYEPPAKHLRAKADTLRAAITARYGGTTLTQDSLLAELEARAEAMLTTVGHLREPRKATFEEKKVDVGLHLDRLQREAHILIQKIETDYLR